MQVFTVYRDEIERVANDCWERGEVDRGSIIRLTGAQFLRGRPKTPSGDTALAIADEVIQ
jgi:hypothetical protein